MQLDEEAPGTGEAAAPELARSERSCSFSSEAHMPVQAFSTLGASSTVRPGSAMTPSALRSPGQSKKSVGFDLAPLDQSTLSAERSSRLSANRLSPGPSRLQPNFSGRSTSSQSQMSDQSAISQGQDLWRRGATTRTVFKQRRYLNDTPYELRNLGLVLAFCAIVLLWEAVDHAVTHIWQELEHRLVAYVVLVLFAKLCVWALITWLKHLAHEKQPTLAVSYLYALGTLLLAAGGWGVIATSVYIMVPKKFLIFFWSCSGVLFFTGTILYGLFTKHNALLDIGGCTSLMGLEDSDAEDEEDEFGVNASEPVTPAVIRISHLRKQNEELEAKLTAQEEAKCVEVDQILQDVSRMRSDDRKRLLGMLLHPSAQIDTPHFSEATEAMPLSQSGTPGYGAV